jgi:hypothetical protein
MVGCKDLTRGRAKECMTRRGDGDGGAVTHNDKVWSGRRGSSHEVTIAVCHVRGGAGVHHPQPLLVVDSGVPMQQYHGTIAIFFDFPSPF